MTPQFVFTSTSAAGVALRGRIELSSGSISNRASLYLEPGWTGSITESDSIDISVSSFASEVGAHSFPVFSGVVSRVLPRGDRFYIECVSPSSYMILDDSPVRAWSNKSVKSIFGDLVGSSRFSKDLISYASDFGTKRLHSWNTHAGKIAHELTELLAANSPDTLMFATDTGELYVGTRLDLAKAMAPWPFPSDAAGSSLASGFVDSEASEFSLRPACPHQLVYELDELDLMGTIDSVVHEIMPGRSTTSVTIDSTPYDGLEEFLGTLK